jgi:MFS family permease
MVPALGYMLEIRLNLDPSRTQGLTAALLAIHGFVALISAPIIGHFADQWSGRRIPLLISLAGCLIGTLLVASTLSRMPLHHQSPVRDCTNN